MTNINEKIVVVGTGYVGLSLAVLLARKYDVTAVDIVGEKIDKINKGISPLQDREISEFLSSGTLKLKATLNAEKAYRSAGLVIIAVPTDYDPETNHFNTTAVEAVIAQVRKVNPSAYMVIKSTVPVGYTKDLREHKGVSHILFSPEFLREGRALYDNLYPSRIIVGTDMKDDKMYEIAETFAAMLKKCALQKAVPVLIMDYSEAEAVKLFANTYLALRVSYFNELDTYAEMKHLNTANIIKGVSLDPRIGNYYNNPSFGYGGYCLPKDTKQLLANYRDVPENLIQAIVESNRTRKDYIADRILYFVQSIEKDISDITIGIYRLAMKKDSDNFRHSSILGVMKRLQKSNVAIIIYEPTLPDGSEFYGGRIVNSIKVFKKRSDCIVANRMDPQIADVIEKVYTRDLFEKD